MTDGRTGARVERHQRLFLLKDFEELVADAARDFDARGALNPETVRLIGYGNRVIEWLKGGPRPSGNVREFLEERLAAMESSTGYAEIVYEHDALVAAIEELR